MEMLSQKAFSVFCDEVVRDAVVKNDKLREENASLEPLYSLLCSIQIHYQGELSKEVSPVDYDNADEGDEYLSYSSLHGVEFPHENLKDLHVYVSGMQVNCMRTSVSLGDFSLTIGEPEGSESPCFNIVFQWTDLVRFTGVITNFQETLEEVRSMKDDTRLFMHFMLLGGIEVMNAGVDFDFANDNALHGATFTLTKIELLKHVILQPVLAVMKTALSTAVMEEEVKLLKTLAEVNENHGGLARVAKEQVALVDRNVVLKECRNLAQSVEAHYPGGGSIRFKLDNGQLMSDAEGQRFWCCVPLADQDDTIRLSSVPNLRINLAGPWCNQINPIYNVPPVFLFPDNSGMLLKFSHSISAALAFDESFLSLGLENDDALHYIASTHLRATRLNVPGMAEPLEPEPHLTVRLLRVHFRLDTTIQRHLHLLGVDTTTS